MTTCTKNDRSVVLSSEMVRAVLGGTKTQLRRIMKPQPHGFNLGYPIVYPKPLTVKIIKCSFGEKGDRLWVKEKHGLFKGSSCPTTVVDDATYCCFPDGSQTFKKGGYYQWDKPVTGSYPEGFRWRSPLHMPRWASRATIEITSVDVQRIQDVSKEEIRQEGVHPDQEMDNLLAFAKFWDKNHYRGSWEENPWVWVVSFICVQPTRL